MFRSIDFLQSKFMNRIDHDNFVILINGFQILLDKNSKSTDGKDFSEKFHIFDKNLDTLGLSSCQKNAMYMVLSAILNLSNIEFDASTDGDNSCIKTDSYKFLCHVAALLKVNESDLKDVLTSHTIKLNNQQIK